MILLLVWYDSYYTSNECTFGSSKFKRTCWCQWFPRCSPVQLTTQEIPEYFWFGRLHQHTKWKDCCSCCRSAWSSDEQYVSLHWWNIHECQGKSICIHLLQRLTLQSFSGPVNCHSNTPLTSKIIKWLVRFGQSKRERVKVKIQSVMESKLKNKI